jgi:hypothetical protein
MKGLTPLIFTTEVKLEVVMGISNPCHQRQLDSAITEKK